jgi:transcriptional regulator with XRE-family HTH domain
MLTDLPSCDRKARRAHTGHVDVQLAALSRSIDMGELGRRLRLARVAAGMTQADVAAGEVTAAYISRIEDGQRRPDAGLLQRMAQRMGTTLHQLLTGLTTHEARGIELQVEHAAIALALGDTAAALTAATSAAKRLEEYGDQALLAYALRIQAMAQREAGNVGDAIVTLESLIITQIPDVNTLRAMIALSRCYCDQGRPDLAISLGRRAEQMIHSLNLSGLADSVHLVAAMVDAHQMAGSRQTATAISRDALADAALGRTQLSQAGDYWRASLSEAEYNGATPAAIELARAALALVELDAARASAEHLARISIA